MTPLEIPFIKMHGLGNDFVVVRNPKNPLDPALAATLAHRRRGVGCDQVLVVTPAQTPEAHAHMTVLNADGSEAEACGNGTRCVAALLAKEYASHEITLQTAQGLLPAHIFEDGDVEVTQGTPHMMGDPLDLEEFGLGEGFPVNVGNPHLVIFVKPEKISLLEQFGPRLEVHPFFPDRTNVELVVQTPEGLDIFVWERGAGRTQACGSGACAAVFAGIHEGFLTPGTIRTRLEGGPLWITWKPGEAIRHRGEARHVFRGTFLYEPNQSVETLRLVK